MIASTAIVCVTVLCCYLARLYEARHERRLGALVARLIALETGAEAHGEAIKRMDAGLIAHAGELTLMKSHISGIHARQGHR